MKDEAPGLSLAELSARTGLPGRTIRFYIARGLVPGPVKAGRSARYPAEALPRIEEIQRLQSRGHTLAEIAQRSGPPPRGGPAVEPEAWWQYRLAPDVLVSVRADAPSWRLNRIRRQMAQLAAVLATNDERTNHE
jgi:DNA-binding transcriptional MerR regulator